MDRIYLDHAATTPMRPEAIAAMREGFARWANPSSPHAEGRAARAALEDARARIKAALGWSGELIFTSGASEALWIALTRAKVERRIVSAVEHEAVFRAAPGAAVAPVAEGEIDTDALDRLLSQGERAIVAIQSVNSETGTGLLWGAGRNGAVDRVHAHGGLVLADCAQALGHMPAHVDMAVVSAHKLGGPVGVGALLVRDLATLAPVGGHEFGYRMGTENLPAILGFAAALGAGGLESWATSAERRLDFKNALWRLGAVIAPGVQAAHIIAVAHPALSAAAQLIRLDAAGFAVSAGSACSSGTLKHSRALKGFGVEAAAAARTIRVSLGWNTRPGELDAFLQAYAALAAA